MFDWSRGTYLRNFFFSFCWMSLFMKTTTKQNSKRPYNKVATGSCYRSFLPILSRFWLLRASLIFGMLSNAAMLFFKNISYRPRDKSNKIDSGLMPIQLDGDGKVASFQLQYHRTLTLVFVFSIGYIVFTFSNAQDFWFTKIQTSKGRNPSYNRRGHFRLGWHWGLYALSSTYVSRLQDMAWLGVEYFPTVEHDRIQGCPQVNEVATRTGE